MAKTAASALTDSKPVGKRRMRDSAADPDERRKIADALAGVIGKLEKKAEEQVAAKQHVEQRWLVDSRNYHGRYDADTEQALREAKRSRLFVKLTRAKTHAWEARLSDLLFPTDEKNWGISATPVPELTETARKAALKAAEAADRANAARTAGDQGAEQAAVAEAQGHADSRAQTDAIVEEARERANRMEKALEDQFGEANYPIKARDCIHDMCKLGVGIMKGPVVSHRQRGRWTTQEITLGDQSVSAEFVMGGDEDSRPDYVVVDPWNFFPDMTALNVDEAEFTFERHLWNKQELKKQAKLLKLDMDAVRDLLRDGTPEAMPSYWPVLQEITGNVSASVEERYCVWEFRGVIENEDLGHIARALGSEAVEAMIDDDPLIDLPVVIWFCNNRLLKFGPSLLDSGESLYSVVPFEPDDTSMFGFGVPYLMRDSQAALNGAWRMMMDNGGLLTGPQVIIDRSKVTPADGIWEMTPQKIWLFKSDSPQQTANNAFATFSVQSNQQALENIIALARQFTDDEAGMPIIAQGEQASHVTQTAQGMSMLMNSANVVFRRVVKNFDDLMTVPNVRRLYDYNMQFSTDEDIKGDYDVIAKGTSTLLVREVQAQNLTALTKTFANDPEFGPMLKKPDLLRLIFKTHLLSPQETVKSDDEIAVEAQQRASTGPQVDQTRVQVAQIDADSRLKVAEMGRETALMTLAQTHNMRLDELETRLGIEREKTQSRERLYAAEVAVAPGPRNSA